ncbi:sel1 repeat family protein [archaeon]|nr:MAG: sel1 repeat family protein [archaeon]
MYSQDNMAAQFSVALCYQGGQGVSQNHSEAVKFLRLAAKGGHLEAIHCLGECTCTHVYVYVGFVCH